METPKPLQFEAHIKKTYPSAELAQTETGGYYIGDLQSGKVLSPICTGEAPAWRWAAIHLRMLGTEDENGNFIHILGSRDK